MACDLFGCVVASRQPTGLLQLDETHFALTVEAAANLNRFCLWLNAPLPDGFQCAVFTSWLNNTSEPAVPQLVGFMSNEVPSGVFSICRTGFPGGPEAAAIIGVSVEPIESISALVRLLFEFSVSV
jgi:hypothetical protein